MSDGLEHAEIQEILEDLRGLLDAFDNTRPDQNDHRLLRPRLQRVRRLRPGTSQFDRPPVRRAR